MKHAAGVDMSDVTSLGEITAEGLRQVFPQWRIFGAGGAWWAARGGLQHWTGPESLLLRVISAADLIALAERLCVQSWLDGLDDKALAAVYEGSLLGKRVVSDSVRAMQEAEQAKADFPQW